MSQATSDLKDQGRKSVLSGKEAIKGVSKLQPKRSHPESRACESVLAGPECIRGVAQQHKPRSS